MPAPLVTVHEISKSFGARPLFEGVRLTIGAGERVGLIGPNGAGKSTLARILAQEIAPDSGTVSVSRGLRVAFLRQVPQFEDGATVRRTVLEGTPPGEIDWMASGRADELMGRLELDGEAAGGDALVALLSAGWRRRVALARELMRAPDLLLLDEPTNHLDVESIMWLEGFLAASRFATLTITHDRLFLQRVARRIVELDPRNAGGVLCVDGDYATYVELKADRMAAQERRETTLKNTLRRETAWLRRGPRARTTKQQARIGRAAALKDEVAELEVRNTVRAAALDFQADERRPKRLIEATGISRRYGERDVFRDLDVFVGPGSRIGLLGPNGCGKSTLLRVLTGEDQPTTGRIVRADGLQVATFEQHRDALDFDRTVAQAVSPDNDHVDFRGTLVHVRGYLHRFLFSPEQMDLKVGNLSGGEQGRLLVARLMLRPANLLVLDEPTNDLDLATLNVLEDALTSFEGAVLLVTHDRYFLDQVATEILAFHTRPGERGRVTSFSGLAQWEEWRALQASERPVAPKPAAAPAATPPPRPRPRKLGYKDQREYDRIEGDIGAAEGRLAALASESERPDVAVDAARLVELFERMAVERAEVERLYARWAELEALLP